MILRTSDTRVWIADACRRLSDATGWPVRFVSGDPHQDRPAETILAGDSTSECWSMDVHDGTDLAGRLTIELPADARRDREFLTVCELASITGDLLGGLLTAHSSLRRRSEDVSTLYDVGTLLAGEARPLEAIDHLLRATVALTGFQSAAFFLLAPSVNGLRLRGTAGISAEQIPCPSRELQAGVPDLSALVGGPALIRGKTHRNEQRWLPRGASIGLCVAVQSDAGPLGTLWVYDRRRRLPDDGERMAVESIAAQMATSLEKSALLRENADRHRMQRDLQSASANQPVFGSIDLPPLHPSLEIAGLCASRYELGGDLCEVVPIDDERTVIAVGDASGDSVPAAMVMSAVRGALHALADRTQFDVNDTAETMRRMNRTLYRLTPAHQFMSLMYAVVDAAQQTLTYTNAGHPQPIWFSDEEQPRSLESHGLLLGVDGETTYGSSRIRFRPNDLLVMYSDGISEAQDGRRRLFGAEGIIGAIGETNDWTAEKALEAVLSRVESHAAKSGDGDDRTLLVLRVRA